MKKEYARGLSVISATGGDTETSYFVTDGQGNIRAIIAGGAVTDTYRYDAYGNLIEKTGDSDNDLLYNGEQYSAATGLYYLRARYMDPSTGRFISMDAYAGDLVSPTSTHKYLYANANPVMYSDPSGYATFGETLTSSTIMGILAGADVAAIRCAFDPECHRDEAIREVLCGAAIGGLFGVFGFCVPENVLMRVSIVPAAYGMVASRKAAIEAHQKGYTGLCIYNNIMAVTSAVTCGFLIGYSVPGAFAPSGTIKVNNGSSELPESLLQRGESGTKSEQLHHFATNKNKTYTPQFEEIANKYGLDLDDTWNKEYMPHQGRHPNEYHEYVLDNMKQFDNLAQGDKNVFLNLYDKMKIHITENPDMLYKDYWRNGEH